jgi:hypothetical protein
MYVCSITFFSTELSDGRLEAKPAEIYTYVYITEIYGNSYVYITEIYVYITEIYGNSLQSAGRLWWHQVFKKTTRGAGAVQAVWP